MASWKSNSCLRRIVVISGKRKSTAEAVLILVETIQMSGVFAELELRIIRERVRSGMANAKAKGAKIGRPQATAADIPAVFLRHYPAYKNRQLNVSELARVCDISRTTVYKYLNLLEG